MFVQGSYWLLVNGYLLPLCCDRNRTKPCAYQRESNRDKHFVCRFREDLLTGSLWHQRGYMYWLLINVMTCMSRKPLIINYLWKIVTIWRYVLIPGWVRATKMSVCFSLLADDDVFYLHRAVGNLLCCLYGDEVQCVYLSWQIQQTLHFLNQQSSALPAERTELNWIQLLSATCYKIIIIIIIN